jgi:hypothetical protein
VGIRSLSFSKVTPSSDPLSISAYVFENCTNLENITFYGDGVIPTMQLRNYAFYNCTKLSDFVGVGVDSIVMDQMGMGTFGGCTSLTYDMLNKIASVDGATKVRDNSAARKFLYFKSTDDSRTLTYKGNIAFGEIASWYSALIVDAFKDCASVTKITNCNLTSSKEIPAQAFQKCTNLKEIVFSTSAFVSFSTIGDRAFANCTSLMKIDLGAINDIKDFTIVGANAFDGCPSNGQVFGITTEFAQAFLDAVHTANPN